MATTATYFHGIYTRKRITYENEYKCKGMNKAIIQPHQENEKAENFV